MPEPKNSILSALSINNLIVLCIAFLSAGLIFFVDSLPDIVVLLAATFLLAYLLLGPVCFLEGLLVKMKRNDKPILSPLLCRTLAIMIVYLLLLGSIALIILKFIPALMFQIKSFAHDIPQYLQRFQTSQVKSSPSAPPPLHAIPEVNQQFMVTTSTHLTQKIAGLYGQYVSKLGEYLLDIGTSALSGLVYGLTTLVLTFILLQDGTQLKNGIIELMPDRIEGFVEGFLTRFHRHAAQFIRSQALMSLLAGSMIYFLFWLLDSKYALLLGVFYGVVSIVPVVGPWVGLLALIGFLLFGEHSSQLLPVAFYVGIFYFLKSYWLWPRLLPKQSDIHPVIFLVTLLVCIQLVGILGVLLAFPLASIWGVTFDYLRESSSSGEVQPSKI